MIETAIELKPCPFCGGEDLNLRSDRHMSWVSCTSCGLEAPTETGVTDELAVQYWNSRAPHAKAGVSVKGLEWQDDTPTGLFADTEFGSYGINDAWLERGNEKFEVNLEVKLIGCYPTLEAAKAAAQQDYDARIRSALSTKLQEPVGEVTVDFMQRVWTNLCFDEDKAGWTFQATLNEVVDWLEARDSLPEIDAPIRKSKLAQYLYALTYLGMQPEDDPEDFACRLSDRLATLTQSHRSQADMDAIINQAVSYGKAVPPTVSRKGAITEAYIAGFLASSPTLAHQPVTAGLEKLGRFGHHPDPANDFCIEVEALVGLHFDALHGISKPGTEPITMAEVQSRIARAMDFTVGGDEIAVKAKAILRALAALKSDGRK